MLWRILQNKKRVTEINKKEQLIVRLIAKRNKTSKKVKQQKRRKTNKLKRKKSKLIEWQINK
jgi:hypothetical protein